MSISMEPFASAGHFPSYDPFRASAQTGAVAVFKMQCRSCGFEPDDAVVAPPYCPKCHAKAWERYTRPGSILQNANRY